jgi:hypothetical protein
MEIETAMSAGSGKVCGYAAMRLMLAACSPDFPLTTDEFTAHVREQYPVGSGYAKLRDDLTAQGFRIERDNDEYGGFGFSNTQGIAECGQHIGGSTSTAPRGKYVRNRSERITAIDTEQGCFRTFVP